MSSYLRPRRGKKSTAIAQLTSSNPLKRGEIFFEVPDDGVGTGAGKIKMGDGVTAYVDLPYFSEGGGDVGTVLTQAEYDALTPEQKANGTYWISDASGGSVVIDNALDATSMNAIANKPVAEAITQLNNDLADINKSSILVDGATTNATPIHSLANYEMLDFYLVNNSNNRVMNYARLPYKYFKTHAVRLGIIQGGTDDYVIFTYVSDTSVNISRSGADNPKGTIMGVVK